MSARLRCVKRDSQNSATTFQSAVLALEEHQRRAGFMTMKSKDAAEENRVNSAGMDSLAGAFEDGKSIGERRGTQFSWQQLDPVETMFALLCQSRRHVFMASPEHADGVPPCLCEHLISVRPAVDAPKHERRIERHRGKRIHGDSHRRCFCCRRHDRNTGRKGAEGRSERAQIKVHGALISWIF